MSKSGGEVVTVWSEGFEEVIRQHLPLLPEGVALDGSSDLYRLGLDSLHSVQLVIALEDVLNIAIPDEALTPEAFQTPERLWSMVQGCERG